MKIITNKKKIANDCEGLLMGMHHKKKANKINQKGKKREIRNKINDTIHRLGIEWKIE